VALLIAGLRVIAGIMIERVSLGMLSKPASSAIVSGFIRWDSGQYQRIARHGYLPVHSSDASFYPLYPLAVRGVANIGPFRFDEAALVVSWVALWFGCWGVIRFTADVFPEAKAWRAGMLLAFFPASVFLLAGYAESLFVALAAWTLVALAERRVWIAAGLCGLASATRPEGTILAIAVVTWAVVEGIKRHQHRDIHSGLRLTSRIVALGLLCVSGLVAYSLFLWSRYHHPLEQLSAQKAWKRVGTWPLHPLIWSLNEVVGKRIHNSTSANLTGAYLFNDAVVLFGIIGLAVLMRVTWRRWDLYWFVIPSVLTLLLIVSNAPYGQVPEGEARLVMCIVPLYAVTARARNELGWTALLAGSAVTAAVFQVVFNTGGWLT
jgi:hypothetical protein